MPDGFWRVLAAMLEKGGVVDGEMSWTIKVVRRRDTKHIRGMLLVHEQCKKVEALLREGSSPTAACREVAEQFGKSLRSIEIAYQEHRKRWDMAVGGQSAGPKLLCSAQGRYAKISRPGDSQKIDQGPFKGRRGGTKKRAQAISLTTRNVLT
jgi:hypothetical protein